MKKFLLSVVTLLMVTTVSAQDVNVLGDIDGDGRITVDDITRLIDIYLNDDVNPEPPVKVDTVFTEPITQWGMPIAAVKTQMGDAEILNEADGVLTYMVGANNVMTAQYMFDDNSQLYGSAVLVTDVAGEAIDAQLSASYVKVSESDTLNLYISEDAATIVMLQPMTYGNITYYQVQFYDYNALFPSADFYEPYLGWGTDRAAVKDTLASWGLDTPYYESLEDSAYYQIRYLVSDYEIDTYMFDHNQKLDYVQQMFVGFDREALQEYMVSELGYQYLGSTEIPMEEGDPLVAYYLTTPDGLTMLAMYEIVESGEDGEYTLLFIEYFQAPEEEEGGEEAKSRNGKVLKTVLKNKAIAKTLPAKMKNIAIAKKAASQIRK